MIMTGEQFPIPKKLLQLMDVAFAGSGSVNPPYYENIPTISMDVYDNKPIGAMGYDTNVIISRQADDYKPSSFYLKEILYGNFLNNNKFTAPKPVNFDNAYQVHFEFVNTPMYKCAYIEGIGNLYEFDYDSYSG